MIDKRNVSVPGLVVSQLPEDLRNSQILDFISQVANQDRSTVARHRMFESLALRL